MKLYIRSSVIFADTSMNPRKGEYYQYLYDHVEGVKEAWRRFLKPNVINDYESYIIEEAEKLIQDHDHSKYEDVEFIPYCNYFYHSPKDGFSKSSKDFDKGWLHHLHNNPHHWQYWVLLRDSGEVEPQDMDIPYVFEMLCDWHSFSSKYVDNTAYNWYKDNGNKMKLSNNTKKIVEKLIEYLKDPIMEVDDTNV